MLSSIWSSWSIDHWSPWIWFLSFTIIPCNVNSCLVERRLNLWLSFHWHGQLPIGQLVIGHCLGEFALWTDILLFTCLNSLSTGRLRQGLLLMRRRGTVMVTARPPILPFTSLFPTIRFELKKSQLLILCSGWCLAAQGREASGGGEPRLEPRVGAELVGNDPTVFRYMAYTVTELSSNIKNRTTKEMLQFCSHLQKCVTPCVTRIFDGLLRFFCRSCPDVHWWLYSGTW